MLTSAVVVRVDNAATQPKSPPALSAGVAAIVMGATTHDHNAAFLHQISDRRITLRSLPKLCSWTTLINSPGSFQNDLGHSGMT